MRVSFVVSVEIGVGGVMRLASGGVGSLGKVPYPLGHTPVLWMREIDRSFWTNLIVVMCGVRRGVLGCSLGTADSAFIHRCC